MQLQNATALRSSDAAKAAAYVDRATATAADLLADVRETVALLHDESAERATPFPTLLHRLREDFIATHDIELAWSDDVAAEPPGRVAMVIYRTLQESLTNIARHARARRVDVRISGTDGAIALSVRDDGGGFETARNANGHGLTSMRTRVESIGGTFTISSSAGDGTCVQARVPLEARS